MYLAEAILSKLSKRIGTLQKKAHRWLMEMQGANSMCLTLVFVMTYDGVVRQKNLTVIKCRRFILLKFFI